MHHHARVSLARFAVLTVVLGMAVGCRPKPTVPERDADLCASVRWYTMPADGMAPTVADDEAVAWVPYEAGRSVMFGDVVLFSVGSDVFLQRVVGIGPVAVSFDAHLLSVAGEHTVENAALPDRCVGVYDARCVVFRERDAKTGASWRVQRHAETDAVSAAPTGQWVVPAGHVFVAGDNRAFSHDSRVGGTDGAGRPLPLEVITGRAVAIERAGLCQPIDAQ